jgi:choline kinase
MRVIIPAAGRGTRLQPMTHFSPKCMIDINGKPLLFYMLSSLKQLAVSEVVIVTGFMHTMIEEYVSGNPDFPPVTCIYNEKFETTNSIVSLSHTTSLWDEDFCIIDSDLMVRPELLSELVSSDQTCLFIDNSKSPETIDMKVQVKDKRFIYMDKTLLRKDTFGEFFGLSRWTPEAGEVFKNTINSCLSRGETGIWYEYPIREMAANYELPIRTCSSDQWFEIDTNEDYEKAVGIMQNWVTKG